MRNRLRNRCLAGGPLVTSPVKILVVDDYEPWCRFVCSSLENVPQLRVVGVAADGLEALQKAQSLRPDLILLDIAMPRMNGLESAETLTKLSPQARILFLSQELSPEMTQAAFRLGAMACILKSRAARELLPAIEAVLAGKRFFDGAAQPIEAADQALLSTRS